LPNYLLYIMYRKYLGNIMYAFRNILPSKFCQSGLYIHVHSSCMHCLWTLWEYPVLTSFYSITLHIILQFPYYPVKLAFQKDCTFTGRRVLGKKWASYPPTPTTPFSLNTSLMLLGLWIRDT